MTSDEDLLPINLGLFDSTNLMELSDRTFYILMKITSVKNMIYLVTLHKNREFLVEYTINLYLSSQIKY